MIDYFLRHDNLSRVTLYQDIKELYSFYFYIYIFV